jgi:hypothetical protein
MNRYTLSSDSRRWWLPTGAAGLAAAGVIAVSLLAAPSGSAPTPPSHDVQGGYAQLPDDGSQGYAHIPAQSCPPPPDPAYVGVPWVARDSACPTLRRWWTYVR